jgi:hypothetical protein
VGGRGTAGRRTGKRHAVHQAVGGGLAELVPDVSGPNAWMLFIDGIPQSQVDLDDPGALEFEYVRRIGHVIDLAFPPGQPVRALHLGGGALTLPRYVAHTRPGSAQVVAETDVALTALVRQWLPLPPAREGRIRVRAEDARAVLDSVRAGGYDLVISDVYAGSTTPPRMTTAECAAAARRALRPGGVYLVNVADGPPLRQARAQVATISAAFGGGLAGLLLIAEPGVLRGRRTGNLVLAAGRGPLDVGELREAGLARRVASDPFPARVLTGDDLARFASGATVVTDALVTDPVAIDPCQPA